MPVASKRANLLVVDDDANFLNLLERIFSNHFNMKAAESGEKGLDILNKGYQPDVIICDQIMQGINGVEMLEKSIQILPDAVRILITAHENTRDLMSWLNKSKAFMYLTKPCTDLQLIQTVRIAFEHRNQMTKNKELTQQFADSTKELKTKNELLKKYIFESRSILNQTIQSLSAFLHMAEKYYFTPHSHNVTVIAKTMAERLSLEPEQITNIVTASLLHGATLSTMPHKFIIRDPYELSEEEIVAYFEEFNNGLACLKKVSLLSRSVTIISHIWEHNDGSGYPYGLLSGHISREAQIIALANIYHNRVYRIKPEKVPAFLGTGNAVQTREETEMRHTEAMKFLYKKAPWFDVEILNEFQTMIKKKLCPALVPLDIDLCINMDPITTEDNTEANEMAGGQNKGDGSQSKEPESHEKEIPVADLEAGMTAGQNIVTKTGMLVVRQDTKLDAAVVKNIKQLEATGMIDSSITIILNS